MRPDGASADDDDDDNDGDGDGESSALVDVTAGRRLLREAD